MKPELLNGAPRVGARKSSFALLAFGLGALAFVATHVDAAARGHARGPAIKDRAALVEELGLTDLSLFTEARYTRHPSQADLHTAFQDHPASFEHFPSGSLMAPPAHLTAPSWAKAGPQ